MKKLILLIAIILAGSQIELQAQDRFSQKDSENKINIHQDQRIEKLVQKKMEINHENNMVTVYRIQLYSGNREKAYSTLNKIKKSHSDQFINVAYDQPNFKTKIGIFRTEMEAKKFMLDIRESYTSAFVLKEEIPFEELIKNRVPSHQEEE
jgi:hypothetical protein